MPTRKLSEPNVGATRFSAFCRDPDHLPLPNQGREPGLYEHTCSACGKRFQFSVTRAMVLGTEVAPGSYEPGSSDYDTGRTG